MMEKLNLDLHMDSYIRDAANDNCITLLSIAPITIEDMPAFEQYANYCNMHNLPFNGKICALHINEYRLLQDDKMLRHNNDAMLDALVEGINNGLCIDLLRADLKYP